MPAEPKARGTGASILILSLTVALGIPLVGYLWETAHLLLNGRVDWARVAISVPALLLFLGLLIAAARGFTSMAARTGPTPSEEEPNVAGTLLLSSIVIMFIFGVWLMMYVTLLNR